MKRNHQQHRRLPCKLTKCTLVPNALTRLILQSPWEIPHHFFQTSAQSAIVRFLKKKLNYPSHQKKRTLLFNHENNRNNRRRRAATQREKGVNLHLPLKSQVTPETLSAKLNPRWVETLLGLSVGWVMPSCTSPVTIEPTNSDSSATELFQQPLNSHSELF